MVIMWYNEDVLKSILIHMARLFSKNVVIIPISISWLSGCFCPQTDKRCMLSVFSSFTNQITVLMHISLTTSEFAFHLRLKQLSISPVCCFGHGLSAQWFVESFNPPHCGRPENECNSTSHAQQLHHSLYICASLLENNLSKWDALTFNPTTPPLGVLSYRNNLTDRENYLHKKCSFQHYL